MLLLLTLGGIIQVYISINLSFLIYSIHPSQGNYQSSTPLFPSSPLSSAVVFCTCLHICLTFDFLTGHAGHAARPLPRVPSAESSQCCVRILARLDQRPLFDYNFLQLFRRRGTRRTQDASPDRGKSKWQGKQKVGGRSQEPAGRGRVKCAKKVRVERCVRLCQSTFLTLAQHLSGPIMPSHRRAYIQLYTLGFPLFQRILHFSFGAQSKCAIKWLFNEAVNWFQIKQSNKEIRRSIVSKDKCELY